MHYHAGAHWWVGGWVGEGVSRQGEFKLTVTHCHSLSLTVTLSRLSFAELTVTLFLSATHSLTHSQSQAQSQSSLHSLPTVSHSLTLSLSHSLTHSLTASQSLFLSSLLLVRTKFFVRPSVRRSSFLRSAVCSHCHCKQRSLVDAIPSLRACVCGRRLDGFVGC